MAAREAVLYVVDWFMTGGWKVLLALILSAGGAYLLHSLLSPGVRAWALKRAKDNEPRQFIFRCYDEMERLFKKKGAPRRPSDAPTEYEDILAVRFGHLAPQIGVITSLFNRARYGLYRMKARDSEAAYLAFIHILESVKR